MKILVTGTAGFIGYHLVTKLINRGDEVFGLDSINNYYDVNLKYSRLSEHGIQQTCLVYNTITKSDKFENYSFIILKLEDKENLEKLFSTQNFDVVVNLAAQAGVRYSLTNPQAYIESNIIGFTNLLECCRHYNIKHLVYASSSSVYGLNEEVSFSTSSNVDHPISLYAATKKSNELMAHVYSHLFKLPTTGLRFFTVYGPWGRPDMSYFLFANSILAGEPINVYNNGEMVRDFTYVDDIVEGIVPVIDQPPKGDPLWDPKNPLPSSSAAPYKIYNIGNNNPVTLMEFISAIENGLGKIAVKKMLPLQAGDVLATYANIDGLAADFNYKPKTQIAEGINNFLKWYREYFKV